MYAKFYGPLALGFLLLSSIVWLPSVKADTEYTHYWANGEDHLDAKEVSIPSFPMDPQQIQKLSKDLAPLYSPPKLIGLSENDITTASSGQFSDVIIVLKFQPPANLLDIANPELMNLQRETELAANRESQSRVREIISLYGGKILYEYAILNAISVHIPTRVLALLENMDEVFFIESSYAEGGDGAVNHDGATAPIHFNAAHFPSPSDAAKGTGRTIAIVDSGMYESHMDLDGTTPGSKVVYHKVFDSVNPGSTDYTPTSQGDHGTPVIGVAAGNYSNASFNPNPYRGMAPMAKVFNIKYNNLSTNMNRFSDFTQALDDVYGSKGIAGSSYTADMLNVSQQYKTFNDNSNNYHPNGYSTAALALDRVFEHNILPVVISGNFGIPTQGEYTLATPGDARKVLTVGAVDPGNLTRKDYSGFGPTTDASQRVKPEIMAPTDIIAPIGPNTYDYAGATGTSIAAPVVAGIAAVMKQWWSSPSFPLGNLLCYMIHQGRSNSVDPLGKTGLGVIDSDYFFQHVGSENGYVGSVASGQVKAHGFTTTTLTGTNRLIVTIWWPERRDTGSIYHQSAIGLEIRDANNNLLVSDYRNTGNFARAVLTTPASNQTYKINVLGTRIDTINVDPTNIDPGSGVALPSEQRYYLWTSVVPNHN